MVDNLSDLNNIDVTVKNEADDHLHRLPCIRFVKSAEKPKTPEKKLFFHLKPSDVENEVFLENETVVPVLMESAEADVKLLDLLTEFNLESTFVALTSCGFTYDRLQYINRDDLDVVFPERKYTALKAELREKVFLWKSKKYPATSTANGDSRVCSWIQEQQFFSRSGTEQSGKTSSSATEIREGIDYDFGMLYPDKKYLLLNKWGNLKYKLYECYKVNIKTKQYKDLFEKLADTTLEKTDDKQPKVVAPKKKSRREDNLKNLYPYSKKKIFETLLTRGCNSQDVANVIKKLNVAPDQATEFFNNHAYNTQISIHEECGSLSFENISDWLWTFENYKLDNKCNFETALIMKAIADNEAHPTPDELNGIDLRSIYKFLGNALLGLPQAELDAKSGKFLATEFESLIDDANSDLADTEVKYMKQNLEQDLDETVLDMDVLRDRQSLDPLCLDSDILKFL